MTEASRRMRKPEQTIFKTVATVLHQALYVLSVFTAFVLRVIDDKTAKSAAKRKSDQAEKVQKDWFIWDQKPLLSFLE
eukprot:1984601-Amphidinium_carterae.1